MREKVCESRFRCEGFPGGKGWGKFGEVSVTLLAGDDRILFLSALPLVQFLVTKKGLGSRVTDVFLSSPNSSRVLATHRGIGVGWDLGFGWRKSARSEAATEQK